MRFFEATDQSRIANAYFLDPILRTMGNMVRPPTRKQKFYRREVAFPCPPAVWERISHYLPTEDSRLGIKRSYKVGARGGVASEDRVQDEDAAGPLQVRPLVLRAREGPAVQEIQLRLPRLQVAVRRAARLPRLQSQDRENDRRHEELKEERLNHCRSHA